MPEDSNIHTLRMSELDNRTFTKNNCCWEGANKSSRRNNVHKDEGHNVLTYCDNNATVWILTMQYICIHTCVWQDYIHNVPIILHDNLQRGSHKPYGPPTSVTWLQLLRKQNNSGGRAMAQAVSRRPSIAEARVRFRVSPCGVCGGQSGAGTGFSPSCRFSPVNFIPLVLHYL
jgi:hypothetical protein